jgi:hypothetical protein
MNDTKVKWGTNWGGNECGGVKGQDEGMVNIMKVLLHIYENRIIKSCKLLRVVLEGKKA